MGVAKIWFHYSSYWEANKVISTSIESAREKEPAASTSLCQAY